MTDTSDTTLAIATFEASLATVAKSDVDIVPEFFSRFFAAHPEQREGFYRPGATQGAMVNEMISFLAAVAAREEWVLGAIEDSMAKHQSYGVVAPELFKSALDILVETMAAVAGTEWRAEYADLWSLLTSQLMQQIRQAYQGPDVQA